MYQYPNKQQISVSIKSMYKTRLLQHKSTYSKSNKKTYIKQRRKSKRTTK